MKRLLMSVTAILLVACLIPLKIGVPEELKAAKQLPVKGGDITWTLDFGPFRVYNIQDRSGKILYTDYRTSDWATGAYEFFFSDEEGEEWQCYCEYPTEKGQWTPYLKCSFRDLTPPKGVWTLTDSVVYTIGDTLKIREYFTTERKRRIQTPLLMGYSFNQKNEIRGLVDISQSSNESVWIYPYMNAHQQRAMAASAAAIIIKFRKLHLDASYEHQKQRSLDSDFPG